MDKHGQPMLDMEDAKRMLTELGIAFDENKEGKNSKRLLDWRAIEKETLANGRDIAKIRPSKPKRGRKQGRRKKRRI